MRLTHIKVLSAFSAFAFYDTLFPNAWKIVTTRWIDGAARPHYAPALVNQKKRLTFI